VLRTFFVGAYWGPRREELIDCSSRAVTLLSDLADLGPTFSHWFAKKTSRRRGAALIPVEVDAPSLRELLSEGVNRRDSDRSVIEDLGFSLSIWNGGPTNDNEALVSVDLACGGYSPYVPNYSVISVQDLKSGSRLATLQMQIELMELLVRAMSPSWATVCSAELQAVTRRAIPDAPGVGWCLWLSGASPGLVSLPARATARATPDGGLTILGLPGDFDPDNAECVTSVLEMVRKLHRSSVLSRLS
jgi:hypothetical protein